MKQVVYIAAWVVLGVMLSMLAHSTIEILYIKYLLAHGAAPATHYVFGHAYCALPAWLQIILPLLGILGGFAAGRYFWRVIYIEHRRRWKYRTK